jgi:5-methylcytosine-specific restriction endonuclease McrA
MESNHFRRKPPNRISAKQRGKIEDRKELCRKWWAEGRRVCGICHEPINTFEEMVPDHIEPGSGKSEDESNLQPAHGLCNQIKGSRRNFTITKTKVPLYRRRPGKVMKITDARVYWEGNTCFCDGDKKPKESFCGTCRPKVNPQTMYTLENTDDPDIYREALASAENEILMWRPA